MNSIARLGAGVSAIAGLVLIAGCSSTQQQYVAWVNGEPITADEYYSRVLTVTSIPETLGTDAGGVTIINMVRDRLTDQLAKKRNAVPADELVNAAVDYQMRMDPNTNAAVVAGKLSREELVRQKKYELEAFGIGTDGDKPAEQDIETAFQENKDKPDFRYKASYTVKILQVPDDATGKKIITELKQTGDFKSAAQKTLAMPTSDAALASKEQRLVSDQLRPELRQALDKLKPNEITPEPVAIKIANPQQPLATQFVYAVAQLKSKETEHQLTKAEMRFLLAPIALQKSHAGWKEHYRQQVAEFTKSSKIRVALQRYDGLVDNFIRPMVNAEASGHPPMGATPAQPTSPQ